METLEHLDADSETDAISDIQPVQNVTPYVRQDYHSSPRDSQQRHVRALRRRCRLRSPLYSLIVYVCIAMFVLFYIEPFSYFR